MNDMTDDAPYTLDCPSGHDPRETVSDAYSFDSFGPLGWQTDNLHAALPTTLPQRMVHLGVPNSVAMEPEFCCSHAPYQFLPSPPTEFCWGPDAIPAWSDPATGLPPSLGFFDNTEVGQGIAECPWGVVNAAGSPVTRPAITPTTDNMSQLNLINTRQSPPPAAPSKTKKKRPRLKLTLDEEHAVSSGQDRPPTPTTGTCATSSLGYHPLLIVKVEPRIRSIDASGNERPVTRARNRMAAIRYRTKVQERRSKLEEEMHVAMVLNKSLSTTAKELRIETLELRKKVLEEASCGCPLMRSYLETESQRVVETMQNLWEDLGSEMTSSDSGSVDESQI